VVAASSGWRPWSRLRPRSGGSDREGQGSTRRRRRGEMQGLTDGARLGGGRVQLRMEQLRGGEEEVQLTREGDGGPAAALAKRPDGGGGEPAGPTGGSTPRHASHRCGSRWWDPPAACGRRGGVDAGIVVVLMLAPHGEGRDCGKLPQLLSLAASAWSRLAVKVRRLSRRRKPWRAGGRRLGRAHRGGFLTSSKQAIFAHALS
jgi:hypothetical protein